jgi:hypothetical protein
MAIPDPGRLLPTSRPSLYDQRAPRPLVKVVEELVIAGR